MSELRWRVLCSAHRNKREARSYKEIALSVGVDSPAHITFATDVLAEAEAAKQAGEFALRSEVSSRK